MDYHPIQGGGGGGGGREYQYSWLLHVTQTRVKCSPDGPPGLYADLTYLFTPF